MAQERGEEGQAGQWFQGRRRRSGEDCLEVREPGFANGWAMQRLQEKLRA